MQHYEQEQQVALEAVRQAARLCRSVQAAITPDVLEKKDKSPVTIADFGSQAVICRALAAAFPDDPVIAEEDVHELRQSENGPFLQRIHAEIERLGIDATADDICRWIDCGSADRFTQRFWTLDPIDGTKGFLRGEQYAVSLALIVDGRIDVAVLGCPNLPPGPDNRSVGFDPREAAESATSVGALFHAVRGHGARMVPLESGPPTPRAAQLAERVDDNQSIETSRIADPTQARFCESVEAGHSSHEDAAAVAVRLGITREPLRLDSQAKYAVVARGEAEIYLRLPTRPGYHEKIWDHAGGVLIVEEAGGKVTDIIGKPLDFTRGRALIENQGVIATNRRLHDAVLAALHE